MFQNIVTSLLKLPKLYFQFPFIFRFGSCPCGCAWNKWCVVWKCGNFNTKFRYATWLFQAPPASVAGWYFFGGELLAESACQIIFISSSLPATSWVKSDAPRKLCACLLKIPILLSEIFLARKRRFQSRIHIGMLRLQRLVSATSVFPWNFAALTKTVRICFRGWKTIGINPIPSMCRIFTYKKP